MFVFEIFVKEDIENVIFKNKLFMLRFINIVDFFLNVRNVNICVKF